MGTRLRIEINFGKFLPKPSSPSEAVEVRHDADARRDVVRCPGLALSSASRLQGFRFRSLECRVECFKGLELREQYWPCILHWTYISRIKSGRENHMEQKRDGKMKADMILEGYPV